MKKVEITVIVMRFFRHYRNSYDETTVLDTLYVIQIIILCVRKRFFK